MSEHSKFCTRCDAQVSSKLTVCPFDGATLDDFSSDPMIGTKFAGKYEILAVLGKGGMSTVYKGQEQSSNRVVAIKLMRDHLQGDEIAIERFKREAHALASLKHPNVVSVYESGVTDGNQAFMIMDPLDGATIKHVIENEGFLRTERAVPICEQICDALEHIHQKGVLHRDLKPGNICLVTEHGKQRIRIVDFGFAKMLASADGAATQRALTRQGQVFGSPLYMSPEQCQGKDLDARSDLYSLGCLMYEMLAGVPPFIGATTFDTMSAQVFDKPASMRMICGDEQTIPPSVEAIVMKLLEKDPNNRFQTAEEVRKELHIEGGAKARSKIRVAAGIVFCLVMVVLLVMLLKSQAH